MTAGRKHKVSTEHGLREGVSLSDAPSDVLLLVSQGLFDALRPQWLVSLSQAARALRLLLSPVVGDLREETRKLRGVVHGCGCTIEDVLTDTPRASIYWTGKGISAAGCGLISRWLIGRGQLGDVRLLSLSDNPIGAQGMRAICSSTGLSQLRYFFVSHGQLGSDGMVAFAESVLGGAMPHLTRLVLDSNGIDSNGFTRLAEAVGDNGVLASLQMLSFSGNPLRDAGIKALCRHLGGSSGGLQALQELYLDKCDIGPSGAVVLAAAIAKGALPSLVFLHVDDGVLGVDHPELQAACIARGISLR